MILLLDRSFELFGEMHLDVQDVGSMLDKSFQLDVDCIQVSAISYYCFVFWCYRFYPHALQQGHKTDPFILEMIPRREI